MLRRRVCFAVVMMAVTAIADAEPPRVTDPTDRQILAAFLGHAERSASQCTPERMARFAAQPEDITWQGSQYIAMALTAYHLTGDAKYLDAFVERMDNLCKALTRGPDGYLGWYGLPLGLFRHPEHPDRKVDVMLTSFVVAGQMADFAKAVQADEALKARHAATVKRYLALATDHLVKKWDARGCYKDLGPRGAVYITHPDLKPVKAALTQPHNKHSKIAKALLSLHAATGRDEYLVKAIQLGTRFKRCLTLTSGRYRWNYWDPAGAWDVHPDDKGKWKHWIGVEHRGGYYSLSLSQAVLHFEHGLVFDRTDIDRFVKTQATVCWTGSFARPRWARVDGRTSEQPYLCSALAPFDELIHKLAYGGAAQAERLARRDHSWQGGVVATGYLVGKYLDGPKWKGGQPAEARVVAPFLAKPANRQLVESLAFTVTGKGYQAPLTPSAMKPMPK